MTLCLESFFLVSGKKKKSQWMWHYSLPTSPSPFIVPGWKMAQKWIPQWLCSWSGELSIKGRTCLCWKTRIWCTCSRLVQVLEGLEETWDLSWQVDGWFNVVVLPILNGLVLLTKGQLRRVHSSFFRSVEQKNTKQISGEMLQRHIFFSQKIIGCQTFLRLNIYYKN